MTNPTTTTPLPGIGRDLDKLVAEKLGLNVTWRKEPYLPASWPEDWMYSFEYHGGMVWDPIPEYSTSIAAAWVLVEKYKLSLIREVDDEDDVEWMCGPLNITGIGNRDGTDLSDVGVKFTNEWRLATTAPHAVCLCVLNLPDSAVQ
jgi:hypothetical protein